MTTLAVDSRPAADSFVDLDPTPENHFRLHLLASIYRLLHFLSVMESRDAALIRRIRTESVVADYLGEAIGRVPDYLSWTDGEMWWSSAIRALESAATTHLPLRSLRDELALSDESMCAFMLCGLVEEESRFGAVFAALQTSTEARRPTLELVGKVARGADHELDPWTICRPLLNHAIVTTPKPDSPRAERVLSVPEACWDAARAEPIAPTSWFRLAESIPPECVDEIGVRSSLSVAIERIPSLVRDGRVRSVIIRGTPGSDRVTVARAITGALGRSALMLETIDDAAAQVAALSIMLRAVPVLTYDIAPGEFAKAPPLGSGPVVFVLGPDGALEGEVDPSITLTLGALTPDERRAHWRRELGDRVVDDELDLIVDRFIIPATYIRRAAGVARATAGLDAREQVRCDDVRAACRSLGRRHLETHAERLECFGAWADLVVSAGTRTRLAQLEQFCRHRERVLDHLSTAFGAPGNRGVRALFSGPSGTGKTFAARILAAELGRDLYRLDLGAVVSKYIGETEKNLHQIFSIAEELDVILLLDEGDSLLGGRTDVRSANDRYANLETNYLLQRLEHYQGIVLVTTNLGDNIDQAFERRMDVVAEFLAPAAEERLQIWQLHLPATCEVDHRFLAQVATRCELTGGQIRNAAKQAILLSLDDGGIVRPAHIVAASRIEYQKAGGVSPQIDEMRPIRRRVRSVRSVLGTR